MSQRPGPCTLASVVVAVTCAACTPTQSRLDPYQHDAAAAASLARRAAAVCSCLREGRSLPPLPFTTDGCSMSADGRWSRCCIAHDVAYWCGGSRDDRRLADRRLSECLASHGRTRREGELARRVVRVGGSAWLPLPWRWGYGWRGIRGYERAATRPDAATCFAGFEADAAGE